MENSNNITEFVFGGLIPNQKGKVTCFMLFLLCYLAILLGNLLILITIRNSHLSQQPMYVFLSSLSTMDLFLTSTVAPKMIAGLLVERKTISYNSCMVQLFGAHFFSDAKIFILVAMAYDRYVAICKPLHYLMVMSRQTCHTLVLASFVGAFVHSIVQIFIMVQLPFCGPNQIDHYFCDVLPLLKLVCTETYFVNVSIIASTGVLSLLTFFALIVSYLIILSILRKHSTEGRHKALFTCGSHITVVLMFFLPLILTYIPLGDSVSEDKVFALFYTIIVPMFNPFIYTVRYTDMKNAMRNVWCTKVLTERK
ncbi:olfactory receptor 4P4-like [Tachyglossus aculeatus]|uniref:olfactory receptor 4P4-like n=1 Tax=Tachyglossus aculeatus TaxID=9261 RepID=UPI0018F6E377|nr:olfactory receptor 4P4-like [Tachyglossus aculeatus]